MTTQPLHVDSNHGLDVRLPQGRVRTLMQAPHPGLILPCLEVDPTAPYLVELAADLLATMRAVPGCVGLAASQIAVRARLFAVDVTGHPRAVSAHGAFVLCNARIVTASRWRVAREGCLSIPSVTGDVKRATRIVVEGTVPGSGALVRITTDGLEARAVQHELDHCAGRLFLHRVSGAHAVFPQKVHL